METGHEDEFFVDEVLRLLGENSKLRQKAQRLGADMCQLELQLQGLSSAEPQLEEKEIQYRSSVPYECCDSVYPVSLLKLLNENSFLRSQIQLAEVEMVQLELAVQSRMHLEASDCESDDDESFLIDTGLPGTNQLSKKKSNLDLSKLARSDSSGTHSPKIKAIHCATDDDTLSVQSHVVHHTLPPGFKRTRSRTQSSISLHITRTRKSVAAANQRKMAAKKGPWERSMGSGKASAFMGGRGSVSVDSSSSTFFASLRR